jgi:hypothetical protein
MKKKCALTASQLRDLDPCELPHRLRKYFPDTTEVVTAKLAIKRGCTASELMWVSYRLDYIGLQRHFALLSIRKYLKVLDTRVFKKDCPIEVRRKLDNQDLIHTVKLIEECFRHPRSKKALAALKGYRSIGMSKRGSHAQYTISSAIHSLRQSFISSECRLKDRVWSAMSNSNDLWAQHDNEQQGLRVFAKCCDEYDNGSPPKLISALKKKAIAK